MAWELWPCLAVLAWSACVTEEPPRTRPPAAPTPKLRPSGPCDIAVERHAELELPVWDLIVAEDDWDALHEDVRADVEVNASVCIDGERYPIELELQGSSTRDLDKKSFDLKFNRGKRLAGSPFGDDGDEDGVAKVLMKAMFYDHSLIREVVAFDLFRVMGGEAPRHGFANLRINGAYWGLYVLVEPINEDYLRRHGYPTGGRLYKATRRHGSYADFSPGRDLARAFESKALDDWDADEDMDEGTDEREHDDEGADAGAGAGSDDEEDEDEEEVEDRADIERLVHALQTTPLSDEAFEAEIDPIFPLAEYFERLIWVAWTQNGDGTAQNYYLYNAPRDERDRWYQLPWDSNLCFGADWRDPDAVRAPQESLLLDGRNHFGRRLVRVPGVREQYVARFHEVLDEVLTPEVVLERFDRHSALIARDLAVDQGRWQRNVVPAEAFDVLVDFFEARPDALRDGLAELEIAAEIPLQE